MGSNLNVNVLWGVVLEILVKLEKVVGRASKFVEGSLISLLKIHPRQLTFEKCSSKKRY